MTCSRLLFNTLMGGELCAIVVGDCPEFPGEQYARFFSDCAGCEHCVLSEKRTGQRQARCPFLQR